MTLRKRLLLLLCVAFTVLFLIITTVAYAILFRGLQSLEENAAVQDLRRLGNALDAEILRLSATARDYAAWDATYRYLATPDPAYVEENLVPSTFRDNRLSFFGLFNTRGEVVLARGFDLEEGRFAPALRARFLEECPFASFRGAGGGGLCVLSGTPFLVVFHPVLTSLYQGPPRGTLVLARQLTEGEVKRLGEETLLSLSLVVPGEVRALRPRAQFSTRFFGDVAAFLVPRGPRTLVGYLLLPDVTGKPALVLRTEFPRAASTVGARYFCYLLAAFLGAGAAFGVFVFLVLDRSFFLPLARLSSFFEDIRTTGDLSRRLSFRGKNEWALLGREVNRMLQALARSQEEVQRTASELQAIFRALPDLYFRFARDGTILDVKAGRLADLYRPPRSLLGKRIQDVSYPSVGEKFAAAIDEVARTNSLVVFEYQLVLRGGAQWFEARLLPLGGEQAVAVIRNITERKNMEERLRYLSLRDPLTGLYNRAYFEEELSRLGADGPSPVGLLICDVDGLKIVNDTLGHKAGDELLVGAAEVLKELFSGAGTVARVGGDEFAVLLPGASCERVAEAAREIQEAVAEYNRGRSPKIPLSVSVGFAFHPALEDPDELFRAADNNMYREKLCRAQSARGAIVQMLLRTLEARGILTEERVGRLQELCRLLGAALGLPEQRLRELCLLAQFHDIGMVGIGDHILFKKGPLTPEEVREMQRHCEIGHRIAQAAPDLLPIADLILKHHEWWNGQGYPLGLKGEEIPLECRILAIADAYEKMTSGRLYREPKSHEEALAELKNLAGIQFDPFLVEKFLGLFPSEGVIPLGRVPRGAS